MRQIHLVMILILCGGLIVGCGRKDKQQESTSGQTQTTEAPSVTDTQQTTGSAERTSEPQTTAMETSQTEGSEAKTTEQAGSVAKQTSSEYPEEYTGKDGAKMALIPAGEFDMGDASVGGDEAPVHPVQLDAFYMDVYEVTNERYRSFVEATGAAEPKCWESSDFNDPQQPAVCVSWEDASAYSEWAGKRLPTEAEWEYAARGGLSGKSYPWGNEAPSAGGVYRANFFTPGGGARDGYATTAPVGSFEPNGYGLYDMAGNVWEWCSDWYYEHWYTYEKSLKNPQGPTDQYAEVNGWVKVRRGGAWSRRPTDLRVGRRGKQDPKNHDDMTGFRCVISASEIAD